jgi:hypothetical protein
MKSLILLSTIWFTVGLAACKTTPTPSAPTPPQPKKQETKEASPKTPSESTESAATSQQKKQETKETGPKTPSESTESAAPSKQETKKASPKTPSDSSEPAQSKAQEKSKTSQTATPDATAPQTQTPREKSQAGQPAATEAESEKTDQSWSKTSPTGSQTSQSKLEKARDNLRVSQATEQRIATDLAQLKKSGNASPEDIRNYETYHERVQAMVAENRKIVEKMEAAQARHSPQRAASKPAVAGESEKLSDQTIPEEQTHDRVAELDRQLSASLNEFDAILLKEMESIETESADKMRDLAQEAAEAAKRLKEKGVDLGASDKEKGEPKEQDEDDDKVAARDRPKGGGQGRTGDRKSAYSKEDDDIVARQLREAAENETDPELKEKLWKEYEEYKKNTQQ